MLFIILSGGQRCQIVDVINMTDLQVVDNTLGIPIMGKTKEKPTIQAYGKKQHNTGWLFN